MTSIVSLVRIGDKRLVIDDVVRVADGGAVELTSDAVDRIRAARTVVDDLVSGDDLRALAAPVTLDVPPLDNGMEDHATNALLAVLRTDESLDLLDDIFAIELLMARDAIERNPDVGRLGNGVRAAFDVLEDSSAPLGRRPSSDLLHAAVRDALGSRILPAVEGAGSG